MSPRVDGDSVWMATAGATSYPRLEQDVEVDACVLGGGMTGLLTAWELAERGRSVVVLESGRIASGVTGYTTSKLTSQHGLKYSMLEHVHGAQQARWYGSRNEAALRRIEQLVDDIGIACDLERRDAWVYATHEADAHRVRAEADAAARAGLPARFETDVPLPLTTHGGVAFADQAQLHPRAFLIGLAAALTKRGVRIFEQSAAKSVDPSEPVLVSTDGGAVRAPHVVVATLTPFVIGREVMASTYCHQGYAVACPVDSDPLSNGVFINVDRPMRSLRTIPTPAGLLLQVGGSGWVEHPERGDDPWDDLDRWAQKTFGAGPARYRWSTQDYSVSDGVPLVGELGPQAPGVLVATGFGGWGLTMAGVAAELCSQRIDGIDEPWHALFAPARAPETADTGDMSAHRSGLQIDVDARIATLAPGQGVVLEREDGEEIAVSRDADGTLRTLSAFCTHQGCAVLWDAGGGDDGDAPTWSCPCHGSRFALDGSVLQGPAREPLPER